MPSLVKSRVLLAVLALCAGEPTCLDFFSESCSSIWWVRCGLIALDLYQLATYSMGKVWQVSLGLLVLFAVSEKEG